MSDFLSQLVARQLSGVPAVQPRLRSIFEPTQPGKEPLWTEVPLAPTASPLDGSSDLPKQKGRAETPVERALTARQTEECLGRHDQAILQDASPSLPSNHRRAVAPKESVKDQEQQATAPTAVGVRSAPPIEVSDFRAPRTGRTAPVFPETTLPSKPAERAPEQVLPVTSKPEIQNIPRSLGKAQRTIQVTIGRVEVRAMLPPQRPVRASAPEAPGQSLEDYLKRRNGARA